jgi:uncharacterized protein (DUF2147 family)
VENKKCVALFILFMAFGLLEAQDDDYQPWEVPYSIEGVWRMVDDSSGSDIAKAKIWIKHDSLYGVIQEIFGKPNTGVAPVCSLCTGKLKGKPIEGMRFMWGFDDHQGHWSKGKIVDFQNGKTYKCDLEQPDTNTLTVFSYIHFIIKIGRTQKWVRDQ